MNRVVLVSLTVSSVLWLGCGEKKDNGAPANANETGGSSNGGAAGNVGSSGKPGAPGGNGGRAGVAGNGGTTSAGGRTGSGAAAGAGGAKGGDGPLGNAGSQATIGGGAGESSAGAAGSGDTSCGNFEEGEIVGTAEKFSFFVTSVGAMRQLSGSEDGFGGDLRFGETGPGAGLRGADKICRTIAEMSMPGAGAKGWRAFLSVTTDGCGSGPINAIDRLGDGPWYDRLGRLVAENHAALLEDRPGGADTAIVEDLPNENGVPNHIDGFPNCINCPDNHDTLTGSDETGKLYVVYSRDARDTCQDWTNATYDGGRPMVGHSWSSTHSGTNWASVHAAQGCLPGVIDPTELDIIKSVGWAGGYGGLYCFASKP